MDRRIFLLLTLLLIVGISRAEVNCSEPFKPTGNVWNLKNLGIGGFGLAYHDDKWYVVTTVSLSGKVCEIDKTFSTVLKSWDIDCDIPYSIQWHDGKWYIVGGNVGTEPEGVYECDENFNCTMVLNSGSTEPTPYDIFPYNGKWYLIGNSRIVYEFDEDWNYTGNSWDLTDYVPLMGAPYGLVNLNGTWYVLREEWNNNRVEKFSSDWSYIDKHLLGFPDNPDAQPTDMVYVDGNWYILSDNKVYEFSAGTCVNEPPIITLISPLDGEVGIYDNVTLSFTVTDPEGKNLSVEVYGDGELITNRFNVTSGSTLSIVWDNLEANRNHSWYVIATDADGLSSKSDVWYFSTERSCCPHVSLECEPSDRPSIEYACTVTYTHDKGEKGGIMVRWEANKSFTVVIPHGNCEFISSFVDDGWNGFECYYLENGTTLKFNITADVEKPETIPIYYRAWDISKDGSCDGRYDYGRDPFNGTCSWSCNFDSNPNAWFECNSYWVNLTFCPYCEPKKCPDLNNDTIVDSPDLYWLVRYWCPEGNCTEEQLFADLNRDEKVDVYDVCCMVQYWNENVSEEPFCNELPQITLISPSDGATISGQIVTLKVRVTDPDDDNMSVSFFKEDGKPISDCTYFDIASNSTVSCDYSLVVDGMMYLGTFGWYVKTCDDYDCTVSDVWHFSTDKYIFDPVVILEPGYYEITRDIYFNTEVGIDIRVSNVTINGLGHSLIGTLPMWPEPTICIRASRYTAGQPLSNIIIYDVNLRGWRIGVHWSGVNESSLEKVNANSCEYGALLYKSHHNTLSDLNFSNNSNIGLFLSSSNYNEVNEIVANNNNGSGIDMTESNENNISNAELNNNGNAGIYLLISNNNKISSSSMKGNNDGAFLISSNFNEFTNCEISMNEFSGMELFNSTNNKIYDNQFNNDENIIFIKQPLFNVWSTTVGNYWATPSRDGFSETCVDANGDGICDSSYQLDENNIDYYPKASIS